MSGFNAVSVDGKGPMQRWAEAQGNLKELAEEVFGRLTDADNPQTLEEIARGYGYPRGVFVQWFTQEQWGLFDAALKVLGSGLGSAVKRMTDETTNETLKLMKFKTDRYLRLAGHLDPERYSPRTEVKHSGLVPTLVIEIGGVVATPRVIEAERPVLPAEITEI